jgi:hypothetical protein
MYTIQAVTDVTNRNFLYGDFKWNRGSGRVSNPTTFRFAQEKLGAFRAGYHTNNNATNISTMGNASAAFCGSNTVQGTYSFGAGDGANTGSSATYSFALGRTLQIDGLEAGGMGKNHSITAVADGSFVFGSGGTISAAGSTLFSLGYNNASATNTLAQADTFSVMGGVAGFGTVTPTAQLEVVQADSVGAIPAFKIKQTDESEEMIELDGTTIGVGNAIEAVGAKTLTTTHFIKVTITGVGTRYIPVGTIA